MVTRKQVSKMLPSGYELVDTTFEPVKGGHPYPWLGIRKGDVTARLYPIEFLETKSKADFAEKIRFIIKNW